MPCCFHLCQVMYTLLLYINRESIIADVDKEETEEEKLNSVRVPSERFLGEPTIWYRDLRIVVFLYEEYRPSRWYWEVVSTVRRLLMTAGLSIVSENSGIKVRD